MTWGRRLACPTVGQAKQESRAGQSPCAVCETHMAAPIITCPACTKKFKGKEGLQGKRIKCPLCATPFVVTAEQLKGKGGAKAAGQAKTHQRVTWNKEDDDSTGYQLGEFDLRARCPNCANLLESEDAIICLFCGYNTQTR